MQSMLICKLAQDPQDTLCKLSGSILKLPKAPELQAGRVQTHRSSSIRLEEKAT